MSNQAIQIEKTGEGYMVFGRRFSTRIAAEDFVWAQSTQSKLRSEQFLWESLRDVARPRKKDQKQSRTSNQRTLDTEVAYRLAATAEKHRGWVIATVFILAAVLIASYYLANVHPVGRWFFLSFFAWWFMFEKNFWRCPACDVKIAPGLYHSAVTIHQIGECPGCKVSLNGETHDH